MPKITAIPATRNIRIPEAPLARRKVAGYARVSTDSDEQFTSYEAQVDYYTKYIRSHTDWEFVGVYTDEGISALSTAKRDGFKQMVSDALEGKIQLIVTKSVSRFARNTVDSLTTIRNLKAHGVEVYFEKENIWTFDAKGELLITLMSSLAQEESRSISENVTWGRRKRMADGQVCMPYGQFLGYRKGPDGKPEIVEEEAALVRRIYRDFISGMAASRIAKTLTKEGIPTPGGREKWQISVIESILSNEKYKGDARLQKKFTVDFLTKKMKVNEGEVPQFYVEGSHPAIVDPVEWELVQQELARRKSHPRQRLWNNGFGGKIVCGECGAAFGPKVWHSTYAYRRTVWQCNRKYQPRPTAHPTEEKGSSPDGEKRKPCSTPHLTEEQIKTAFCRALGVLLTDRDQLLADGKAVIAALTDCTALDKKAEAIDAELAAVADRIEQLVKENAVIAADQDEYSERYNSLAGEYETLQRKREAVEKEKKGRAEKKEALESFYGELEQLEVAFSPQRWNAIVEKVVVETDGAMTFFFVNGGEVVA